VGEEVHSHLKTLIELQSTDEKITELSSQIDAFPKEIQALEKQLKDFIQAHEERQHRLAANQKERRDLEGEIQLIRQKISKHKDQLYQVKTNEQYRAMLREIEGEEANIRKVEDLILEKMIEAEEIQKKVKEAAARLEEEKSHVAAETSRRAGLLEASTEERNHALRRRQELSGTLEPGTVTLYERVRKGRNGRALAEVRNGMCTGCNVLLRPQLYNNVRANEALYECENCARILFYVEPVESGEEPGDQQAVNQN
jgi:uncharacterized protein